MHNCLGKGLGYHGLALLVKETGMPIGYIAYYAGSFEDLKSQQTQVAAQEEATPEGTLVLLELTLADAPQPGVLSNLNARLLSAGVPPWEGYGDVVFADPNNSRKVYIAWTKGFAWASIIIFLLPAIIGAVLWFLIPEPVRNMLMMMGVMMIMVPFMGMMKEMR